MFKNHWNFRKFQMFLRFHSHLNFHLILSIIFSCRTNYTATYRYYVQSYVLRPLIRLFKKMEQPFANIIH